MDGGQEKKRPVLPSSEELKGKKAAPKKSVGKWLALLALVLVLGGAWAVYRYTGIFDASEPESTPAPSTSVKLIDRQKSEFDRLTVSGGGIEPYTVVNNNVYDEDGNAVRETPAPEAAPEETPEAAPQPTPEPEREGGAPEEADGEAPEEAPAEPVINEPLIEQEFSIEGRPYFRVNTSPAASMHMSATSLSALDTVEQDAQDLAVFGLDQPALTVVVQYKDGTTSTLHFGDKTPLGSSYYLRMDDDNTVYTVSSSSYSTFNKQLEQLHTLSLPQTVDSGAIGRLLIEQRGKDTIEIRQAQDEYSASISTLRLVRPIEYDAHISRTPELVTEIASVKLNGYVAHASTPEALEPYGLRQPRARVRYEDANANVLDLVIGDSLDELYTCVLVDDTGDVYRVETLSLNFLADATVAHLVDQFSNLVNIEKVDVLTVSAGAERFVLSIEREQTANEDGTTETVATYLFDGEPTEEKLFKGLYQDIIGLLFDKMKQEDTPTGDAVAGIRYQLNSGLKDINVEYLAYDKDYYAIRQDGRVLFLIKRDKVDTMLEKCRQFRDGTYVRS